MAKYPAKGCVVKAAATATPTNVVTGIQEFEITGGEREMINVTNQASTVTEEFIPNPLRKVRSLKVKIFYDPADTEHERIRAAHNAATLEYQTVVFSDTGLAQIAFTGYVTEFTIPSLGVGGALEASYTLQCNGADVFTA